ncbi:MAG: hypothetical protein WCO09_03125 [bacterium]
MAKKQTELDRLQLEKKNEFGRRPLMIGKDKFDRDLLVLNGKISRIESEIEEAKRKIKEAKDAYKTLIEGADIVRLSRLIKPGSSFFKTFTKPETVTTVGEFINSVIEYWTSAKEKEMDPDKAEILRELQELKYNSDRLDRNFNQMVG